MRIRSAKISDVEDIYSLVKQHAAKGELLPRPVNDLYEKIQEFVVVEEGGKIAGCGALHVTWEDLAEVRSLIVRPGHQGKGLALCKLDFMHFAEPILSWKQGARSAACPLGT